MAPSVSVPLREGDDYKRYIPPPNSDAPLGRRNIKGSGREHWHPPGFVHSVEPCDQYQLPCGDLTPYMEHVNKCKFCCAFRLIMELWATINRKRRNRLDWWGIFEIIIVLFLCYRVDVAVRASPSMPSNMGMRTDASNAPSVYLPCGGNLEKGGTKGRRKEGERETKKKQEKRTNGFLAHFSPMIMIVMRGKGSKRYGFVVELLEKIIAD